MVRNQGPRLSKALLLDVELSAICSRERYTTDPAPVIEALRGRAGDRTDILAHVTGTWAGYYADQHTQPLADALLTIEGADQVGTARSQEARGRAPQDAVTHAWA